VSSDVKTLIWDFDGTLGYRTGGMFGGALREVVHREAPALDVPIERFRPYLQSGFPWHTPDRPHPEIASAEQWWDALDPVFERALKGVGLGARQAHALAKQVRHVYPDPERWRLFDDTMPTLGRLSAQGWTHVLLSNHVPELPRILHHLGLLPQIASVLNSADTGYEKPHPQAFRLALEAMGSVTAVWMIGDSYSADVAGAEAAGVPAILVRRHHAGARHYCDGLAQVETILNKVREHR
jgi:putative hydrolase of the HAD superfamily